MNISHPGTFSIPMRQEPAALGPDLRGRKIVITIMPGSFFIAKRNFIENDPSHDFAMNFSRLHGYETIFSPYLSYGIKNEIAKRLSDFPETIRQAPFFKFAILHTASTSISDRALYFLIWPLGELQTEILRLQDHFEVMFYIWSHRINPDVPKIPRAINWDQERQNALAEQILNTNNNPYAVENFMWWYFDRIKLPLPAGSNNDLYSKSLLNSQEWTDLKVLLTVLQQLGAKPLILSLPVNDHLWQVMGVSEQTQDIYYTKFHSVVDPYNLTVLDFRQYGTDMYFSIDQGSHISREGWVHVDQTLDAFFHDRIH